MPVNSNIPLRSKFPEKLVGFVARNKAMVSATLFCGICSLILRDPVQLPCAHRQCKSCIDSMDREIVKCPECHEETEKEKAYLDKGFKNDMKTLAIDCFLCKWNGSLRDYEHHLEEEHRSPLCEPCGSCFNSANSLVLHQQYECDKVTVACSLKDFGCSDAVVRVCMRDHYISEQHQSAILTLVRRVIYRSIDDQYERDSVMHTDAKSHPITTMMTTSTDNTSTQLQVLYETLDTLAGGTQVLHDDAQRLNNESINLQSKTEVLNDHSATLKLTTQEQNIFLNGFKLNQDILSQDIASLNEMVNDIQHVSYDGTFLWKITAVANKMTDAQLERQTSIYSPPFYSSPTGYKMRARLYLHGDGNARRTHMSLFFVLMRGKYDELLSFPFKYKVTFCLYDQTPAQRHIIDSFRPDSRSSSFQQPRSEMNIASGIPKFFPLAMIQQEGNLYVRDDTMFIKIMVDFNDLPKKLLPYAMSLNPGLPMNIQQKMIKQEAERQEQQKDITINLLPQSDH